MSNVPVGAKIIAVLNYIGAVLLLISGISAIVSSGIKASYISSIVPITLGPGLFVVMGIILIALAVLFFFLGRGLWKGQQWARIVEIVLAIIGVISAIVGMFQGAITSNIVSLVIDAIIGGYLLFSKQVKEAFK